MIMAALTALPLISAAGKALSGSGKQGSAGFSIPGQGDSAGQTLPDPANSTGKGHAGAHLGGRVLGALLSLQDVGGGSL